MGDWAKLQRELNFQFANLSLLQQAFVHRSYLNENPDCSLGSNERLEFLGDAFLGLVIAEALYQQPEPLTEGEMTRIRSAIVCQESLAKLASSLHLGDYLYLGQGEEKSGGRKRPRNLACAFEALIGAALVDRGIEATRNLILRLFNHTLRRLVEEGIASDYKSRLQELVQAERQERPVYQLVAEEGPDHNRRFTVEVLVGGKVAGRGSGKSKQLAEKEAARKALERWE
ncbi:MAG: ribonuclease III [Chloroflexi bacterium]|nr:MAG: ribonuclease III [Chloroflexota bacterium]RLC95527.1 MAG: ribonuclease III [Chloroflexota bacterium]